MIKEVIPKVCEAYIEVSLTQDDTIKVCLDLENNISLMTKIWVQSGCTWITIPLQGGFSLPVISFDAGDYANVVKTYHKKGWKFFALESTVDLIEFLQKWL